jgi:hypothetical protein
MIRMTQIHKVEHSGFCGLNMRLDNAHTHDDDDDDDGGGDDDDDDADNGNENAKSR